MARVIDVLVKRRVDVPATALEKQSDRSFAEIVFNHGRREAGNISRIRPVRHSLNRMAGKVVDDGKRPAVILAINPQDTDLGIDRPNRCHLGIGRHRVGVPHVNISPVFHSQPTVFLNTVLMTAAGADRDRRQFFESRFDGRRPETCALPRRRRGCRGSDWC